MTRPRCRLVVLAATALASLALAGSATAQQVTPTAALERLFTSDEPSPSWFADSFLDRIGIEQVASVVDQTREGLGAFASVEPDGDRYRVVFEDGFVPAIVQLDAQGRIQGLRLLPVVRHAADVAEAVDRFAEPPGSVAVLVTRDGTDVASLAATDRLAVGSAFKLAVLGQEAVEAAEGAGAANRPYLRTREAFVLKASDGARERYLATEGAGRR